MRYRTTIAIPIALKSEGVTLAETVRGSECESGSFAGSATASDGSTWALMSVVLSDAEMAALMANMGGTGVTDDFKSQARWISAVLNDDGTIAPGWTAHDAATSDSLTGDPYEAITAWGLTQI